MFYEQILNPIISNCTRYEKKEAFCIEDKSYTFCEFGACVANIRALIQQRDMPNLHVGLVTNNDLETYASIVALWLEGYCYVPLHIKQPIDRCLDIIEQVEIDTILDSSKASRYDARLVLNTKAKADHLADLNPKQEIPDSQLAYILFTSGSTGKPKGVALSRMNIASFMDSFWATGVQIDETDRCLQCFDLTFDVSVQCYLSALTKGASVYTVPYGEGKYMEVAGLIDEYHLTFAVMAPSMLRYMQPFFKQIDMTSLKGCILTAEACPREQLESIYQYCPDIVLYDFYGPTECTIYCTYYKLNRECGNKELNGIISIGQPLKHCKGVILNEQGEELPNGEKGELCIAGDQVTHGYWKNDEKNASSFFMKDGERYYHTGDLCYKDADGDIMYSGRMDNQIKIQGFRVELGEIEYHAREVVQRNVLCLAIEESGSLILHLVVEGKPMDTKPVLDYMKAKMPHYMIPAKVHFIEKFPLNNSDKIDRPKIKKQLTEA